MRALIAGFVALIVVAFAGTVYLNSSGGNSDVATTALGESPSVPPPPPQGAVPVVDPESANGGLPPRGVEPAVTAAVDAVRVSADLVTAGHFTRRDLIRSFTTGGFAQEMIDLTSAALLDFQFEVNTAEGFWILEQPITARAEVLAADRVRVSMWSVVVVASTEFGVGRETWETVTVEMSFVDDAWLVDSWESNPGPAPAPSAELVFAAPSELGVQMSWPAAGEPG